MAISTIFYNEKRQVRQTFFATPIDAVKAARAWCARGGKAVKAPMSGFDSTLIAQYHDGTPRRGGYTASVYLREHTCC